MTDDDWQPLPPERVVGHPGELAVVQKRPPVEPPSPEPPSKSPSNPQSRSPSAPPAPPDPQAEQAMQALAAKIAAAPPARSLIASVQHRQQKAARQQARQQVAAAKPELAATVVKAAPPAAPAPVVAYAAGPNSRDEREDSEWFRALPTKEQERLAKVWRIERERFASEPDRRRHRFERAAAHGACVFFLVGLMAGFLSGSWAVVAKMTIAGSVAAVLAAACGGGRFRHAIFGAATFLLVLGPATMGSPFMLYLLLACSWGMAAIGMDVEMRRSGGFRDA